MSEEETKKIPLNCIRLSAWEKFIPKWRGNDLHGDNGLVLELKMVAPNTLNNVLKEQYSDENEKMMNFLKTFVRVKHSIIIVDDSVTPDIEFVIDSVTAIRDFCDAVLIKEIIETLLSKAGVVNSEILKKV